MKKIVLTAITVSMLATACGNPEPKTINTITEKIGNLTLETPTGWNKELSEYDSYVYYSYSSESDGDGFLSVVYDKKPSDNISISDFDYLFKESHDGIDIVYTDISDSFLGDKPIRIGHGTWQYNFEGTVGDLYDLETVAMYDADLKRIEVSFMHKDELANEGYADYAEKLIDTMNLVYDYN